MPPGGFDALLAAQGGACAICGTTSAGGHWGTFNVDRGPAGEARGLLCYRCATVIRLPAAVLERATAYLRHPAASVLAAGATEADPAAGASAG